MKIVSGIISFTEYELMEMISANIERNTGYPCTVKIKDMYMGQVEGNASIKVEVKELQPTPMPMPPSSDTMDSLMGRHK